MTGRGCTESRPRRGRGSGIRTSRLGRATGNTLHSATNGCVEVVVRSGKDQTRMGWEGGVGGGPTRLWYRADQRGSTGLSANRAVKRLRSIFAPAWGQPAAMRPQSRPAVHHLRGPPVDRATAQPDEPREDPDPPVGDFFSYGSPVDEQRTQRRALPSASTAHVSKDLPADPSDASSPNGAQGSLKRSLWKSAHENHERVFTGRGGSGVGLGDPTPTGCGNLDGTVRGIGANTSNGRIDKGGAGAVTH